MKKWHTHTALVLALLIVASLLLAACQQQLAEQPKQLSSAESNQECGNAEATAVVVISTDNLEVVHEDDIIDWMNQTGRQN